VRARRHVLAGVCQGLSVATGVDVTLVRLAFIAVGLTGVGVLAYVLLALLLPREDPARGRPLVPAPPDTARWLRVALLVVPIVSILGLLGGPWHGLFGFWNLGAGGGFGLLLVAAGVLVIWLRRRDAEPAPEAPPVVAPEGAPAVAPAWWEQRLATAPDEEAAARSAPPMARPSRSLTLTLARVYAWLAVIAAVVVGVATIWLERIGALSIPRPVLLFGVGVLAIGVIVSAAIWARSAMPIVASTASLLVPVVLIVTLGSWHGGVGNRLVTPSALGPTQEYRLAIGRLTLDLTDAGLNGQDVTVNATDKIGTLEVLLPADVSADVNTHVGAGQSRVLGRSRSGLNVSDHTVDTPPAASGIVRLDLDVSAGGITVCRLPTAAAPLADGCAGVVART
jgi:phage shock protein PspC (stress-responsive transcriptional regulator)